MSESISAADRPSPGDTWESPNVEKDTPTLAILVIHLRSSRSLRIPVTWWSFRTHPLTQGAVAHLEWRSPDTGTGPLLLTVDVNEIVALTEEPYEDPGTPDLRSAATP